MAGVGIILAEKLIEAVGTQVIKEIYSMWGFKSDLVDLKDTFVTVRKVLLDAEGKRELSNEALEWIEKLKDAVYDADDLFDKLRTLAELQHAEGGKFSKKVRQFFSSKNQLSEAYKLSREVKNIKKKLDAIVCNHSKFGFSVDCEPICRRRREETCSYVDANFIVGRDDDKKAIIDKLLDCDVKEDVCFLSIVGVGGLGKTTVAQLVYDDEIVKGTFPLRFWVCVSDQDGICFNVKEILAKVVEMASGKKPDDSSTLEWVQNQFQVKLGGKKFLIVLDDVWNEDRDRWLDLEKFLRMGRQGSRIVVTSRSENTARVIGNEHSMYKLKMLSDENAWCLFKMAAFGEGQEHTNDDLVEIGKKIIRKCCNIPIALKVIGSLLFGKEKSKWRSFEESGLAEISMGENKIMSILKLSYHNLDASLKSCFRFCAVFPKDFSIRKERLINLWMAQGYIVPFDGAQSIEDAAEEYFSILLRRCFFQDVTTDEFGEVSYCKIHDLMHDVAQEAAGSEIRIVDSVTDDLNEKTRHLYYVGNHCTKSSFSKIRVRSYLHDRYNGKFPVDAIIANWVFLRSVDLNTIDIKILPDSICKLLHLRFLNLAHNKNLELLPSSMRKLRNLQTLDLSWCTKLKELPKDLTQLVNLRHLGTRGCDGLRFMPGGMDRMTCMRVLTQFVVDEQSSIGRECVGRLEDLEAMSNLRGRIDIRIYNVVENIKEGKCLRRMECLKTVSVRFPDCDRDIDHEALFQKLQPHPNLKCLTLSRYQGKTF